VSEKNPIRVFVTHAFSESDDYLRVFEFLESVDRFFYINVSKPENVPAAGGAEAIKDELIKQIKGAEAFVVIADALEAQGDLVRYMMDVAEANDIGMMSIHPFGGVADTPPDVVERVTDDLEWNARTIVDTITYLARGQETARWEVVDFPGYNADGEVKDE
jgi:hypothetical protein